MNAEEPTGINVGGSISGIGNVVGHGSTANVTITQGDRNQIAGLLGELRQDVERSGLPDSTKKVLQEQTLAELEAATREADPKPKIETALTKANTVLEAVGATTEQAGGVLQKLQKIATHAGIAFATVAPFAAKLLGQ